MTVTELTTPARDTILRGPDGRWRPSRAGLVNVWQYADETFEFANGRLVLFGPNGSGKTMALELLFPYLLDANGQPARLSTAGGNERGGLWDRVAGYAERSAGRVGYLWAEFHRSTSRGDEYFTCGTRLEPRPNGGKHHWFTTDQRPGFELRLLDSGRVPLDAVSLRTAIGDRGTVWGDDTTGYRKAVRTTLYPGFRDDQYRALIDGLLAVRKQSITDGLTDTRLNELLTNGLPALEPAELDQVAHGFEQLDARRATIDELQQVVEAGDAFARRVRTYSRSALREIAGAVSAAETAFDRVTRDRNEAAETQEQAKQEADETQKAIRAKGDAITAVAARIEGIKASESYKSLDEIGARQETSRRSADQADKAERFATRRDEEATQAEGNATAAAGAAEGAESEVADQLRGVGTMGRSLQMEIADSEDPATAATRWATAVHARESEVEAVRERLRDHEAAVQQREVVGGTVTDSEAQLERTQEGQTAAGKALDAANAQWAAAARAWAAATVELAIDESAMAGITVDTDVDGYRGAVTAAHTQATVALALAIERNGRAVKDLQVQRGDLDVERERLEDTSHVIAPARLPWSTDRDPDRSGAALWALVDAGPDVTDLAGLEAALEGAGLLDLFVTDGPAVAGDTTAIAAPTAHGRTLADLLTVDSDAAAAAGVSSEAVTDVLRAVAVHDTPGDHGGLVVDEHGSFSYGPVSGLSAGTTARFIGAASRERARLDRLEVVRNLINDLDDQISSLRSEEGALRARVEVANAERDAAPSESAVLEARNAAARAADRVDDAVATLAQARERFDRADGAVRDALLQLHRVAADHRLPTDRGALNQLDTQLRDLRRRASNLEIAAGKATTLRRAADNAAEQATTRRGEADEAAGDARNAATQAAADRALLEEIQRLVGADAQQALDDLAQLSGDRTRLEDEQEELRIRHTGLVGKAAAAEERLSQLEGKQDEARTRRDQAGATLQAAITASLNEDASLDLGEDLDLSTPRARLRAARGINQAVTGDSDRHRLNRERAQMDEERYKAQAVLSGRADLAVSPLPTDPDFHRGSATLDGVEMSASAMVQRFRDELDRARNELADSEAQLFEDTLTGSLRAHLASRLRAARQLVDGMNVLLAGIRSASGGVAVSLKWEVADDHEDSATLTQVKELLLRDHHSDQERQVLHEFLARRIDLVRNDDRTTLSWRSSLEALFDYRRWHRFRLMVRHDRFGERTVPFTSRSVSLSAGEKSLVLSLPLFAAVASHYMPRDAGGDPPECPRFLLLDEVFPKNDRQNKRQILGLLVDLDLDCVLTSDKDMCDYDTIDGIAIAVVSKDGDTSFATRLVWNGHQMDPVPATTGTEEQTTLL